jgi:hypothetical protein
VGVCQSPDLLRILGPDILEKLEGKVGSFEIGSCK